MSDPFAELDDFGHDAKPEYQFAPKLESIPNGDYDCCFEMAEMQLINVRGRPNHVMRAKLRIGFRLIEHIWWLNSQANINRFLADLMALEFPTASWGSNQDQTPLSTAIPRAVDQLPGIRFRAAKTTRVVPARPSQFGQDEIPEKTFHDLHIGKRLPGQGSPNLPQSRVGLPGSPTLGLPAPNNGGHGANLSTRHSGGDTRTDSEEDIPF